MLSKSHRFVFQPYSRAVPSCHLAILKNACVYWLGALTFEIAWNHNEPIEPYDLCHILLHVERVQKFLHVCDFLTCTTATT